MDKQKSGARTLGEFRSYFEALLPGLGGAVVGGAFFIVFGLIGKLFDVGSTGFMFLALYAGGCGGFLFGRHWEAKERDKASKSLSDPPRSL